MSLAVGVDIGGTKVAAGVVSETGEVIERVVASTPSSSVSDTEDVIAALALDLASRHDVAAVGIGAAGLISADQSTVVYSPHHAWRDEPLRSAVEARTGLPVTLDNDANAAAWGEYRFGAAAGSPVAMTITVGTGIGGGLVVDGALFRGANGFGMEPGHMTVVQDGRRCACGNRGCWEMYASGRALARDARELAEESPMGAERLLDMAGGEPRAITGPMVTEAAREGDPAAVEIFTTMGRWLGRGLAVVAAVLDPSLFVIGGGVSDAGGLLIGPARAEFRDALTGRRFRPLVEIVAASLGPDAGLVGAADLARIAAAATR